MLRLLVQPISPLQFLLLLIGCAASPTQTESFDYRARAETQVDGGVRVVDTFKSGKYLLEPGRYLHNDCNLRVTRHSYSSPVLSLGQHQNICFHFQWLLIHIMENCLLI